MIEHILNEVREPVESQLADAVFMVLSVGTLAAAHRAVELAPVADYWKDFIAQMHETATAAAIVIFAAQTIYRMALWGAQRVRRARQEFGQ